MHFTGEISAGSLSIVITLIVTAVSLGMRLGALEQLVRGHTTMLKDHADRMLLYERSLTDIGGNLQRILGRMEATQNRMETASDRSTDVIEKAAMRAVAALDTAATNAQKVLSGAEADRMAKQREHE